MRVKSLIQQANPVPGPETVTGSRSAPGPETGPGPETVTGAMAGPGAETGPAGARRRGPGRRAVLVAALAAGTAAVVAGAALLVGGDGDGPGGRPPGGGAIADQSYYGTTEQLEAAADVIVRGRLGPGRAKSPEAGRGDSAYTLARVEVTATAKGDVPGGRLQLSYPGAAGGYAETAPLSEGKEYVFLLTEDESRAGRYYLVTTMQGWYGVGRDGRATPGPENRLPLSPAVRKALRLTG